MVLTEFGKRVAARDECDNAAKRIRAGADAPRRAAAATARSMCLRELGKAPDSLMMMQYLAIAELADGNPAAAKDGFARILETSPNDPYALYGSGLAGVMLDPAGDTSLMAEALKREPAVKAYFTGFGFAPPDVAPMEGEPKSRFKKRRSPETDNEMKKLSTMDDDGVRGVLDHFGVRDSPDGVVTLECLIRADGSMTDCIVSKESPYNKGVAEFAIPVVEAVKFEPFTLKGAPVDNVPISYTLTLGDGDGKPKQAAAPAPAAPPAAAAPATPAAEPSPHTAPAN